MKGLKAVSQQVGHTFRQFAPKEVERRGLLAAISQQIAALPQVREMICNFSDRKLYPNRPMVTLHAGNPSVYLLGWRQGEFTDIHDHGPSEVGLYVMEGVVTEDLYVPSGPSGKERTLNFAMSRFLRTGDMATCPSQYIHRMGNLLPEVAATLHVYGPVLDDMRLYEVVGDIIRQKGCWGCHHENAPH